MNAQNPPLMSKDGRKLRRRPVSAAVRTAVSLIVTDAYSIADAAQRVGMARESLSRALQRPAVKALQADVKHALLTSRTYRAWRIVAELAESSQSDKVRLEACKTILQAAGETMPEDKQANAQATALIQIIRNDVHHHGKFVEAPDGVIRLDIDNLPDTLDGLPGKLPKSEVN